jgi:psiF repeat
MKMLRVPLLVMGLLLCAQGFAATTPSPAQAAQQAKMTSCNADAKTKALTGDARKTFMSDCLSTKPAAAPADKPLTASQQKMKDCNADPQAKTLKGDARKAFMSTCLKK